MNFVIVKPLKAKLCCFFVHRVNGKVNDTYQVEVCCIFYGPINIHRGQLRDRLVTPVEAHTLKLLTIMILIWSMMLTYHYRQIRTGGCNQNR